nr:MAG TPA: hypothetical protein [Caudoviricetes sp.]
MVEPCNRKILSFALPRSNRPRFDINVEMCSKLSKSHFPKKLGTPDKKLPKLNLAGPDGIPQIGEKGTTNQFDFS